MKKSYLNPKARLVLKFTTVFSLLFLTFIFTTAFTYTESQAKRPTSLNYEFRTGISDIYIPEPDHSLYTKAEEKLAVYKKEELAQQERRERLQGKIDRTIAYLSKVGSPVANEEIATILVEKAEENNADYRVLIAIMMIESGACRQSFAYNCFGYLNGARYSSYTHAFNDLVPKVSRQYAARYGWDFVSLSRAYGQHNWQLHSGNMLRVASSI